MRSQLNMRGVHRSIEEWHCKARRDFFEGMRKQRRASDDALMRLDRIIEREDEFDLTVMQELLRLITKPSNEAYCLLANYMAKHFSEAVPFVAPLRLPYSNFADYSRVVRMVVLGSDDRHATHYLPHIFRFLGSPSEEVVNAGLYCLICIQQRNAQLTEPFADEFRFVGKVLMRSPSGEVRTKAIIVVCQALLTMERAGNALLGVGIAE